MAVGFIFVLLLAGCGLYPEDLSLADAAALVGGDPRAGREHIRRYGCDACHTVPGVRGADRMVGPPLTGLAQRMYVAGMLPNTPDNLILWIRDPPAVDSATAMPNLGVTEGDARDIAAYLYSIE